MSTKPLARSAAALLAAGILLSGCDDGVTAPPAIAPPAGGPRLAVIPTGDPYTYTCGRSIAPDQAAANTQIANSYSSWKTALVTSSGAPAGTLRVRRPSNNDDTVSEGIGYGMLLAVYLDDRATFDKLWAYARAYHNTRGLMAWHISSTGQVLDSGAATDADEDMAFALIAAEKKWGGYASAATTLINNILTHMVDASNVLKPGDVWGGSSITNPSYFIPSFYKVFRAFTGTTRWTQVADKSYEITAAVDARNGSGTGLQPDWTNSSGAPVSGWSYDYKYDAVRVPWRLAMDGTWYCDSRAKGHMDRIAAFFKNVGVPNIKDGYTLSGTAIGGWHNAAFVGAAGSAAMRSTDAAYQRALWDETVRLTTSDYYVSSLRLLMLMFMAGRFDNPLYTLRDGFEQGSTSRWGTFRDPASSISLSLSSPGAVGNYAMTVTYSIASWGGVNATHVSAPENWSTHKGLYFQFYGTNSGRTIRLEVLDNRAAGSTTDTAERWEFKFADTSAGWRYVSIPWSSFTRRADWQPAGAPNDGFNRTQVWGLTLAPLAGSGSFQVDGVQTVK